MMAQVEQTAEQRRQAQAAQAGQPAIAVYQSAIEFVEAIEWRGDNLVELQRWLAPGSPLVDGGKQPGDVPTNMTTLVDVQVVVLDTWNIKMYPSLGRQTTTAAVAVGDWLVRRVKRGDVPLPLWDPADIEVVRGEEFARRYVAVGNTRAPLSHEGMLGSVIATHPRVLADIMRGNLPTSSQIADLAGERGGGEQPKE